MLIPVVSGTAIAAMIVSLVLCTIVPITAVIIVTKRWKNVFGAVIAGALTFFIAQIVLRIPILQILLPRFGWFKAFSSRPIAFFVFLSFTAALFEESGRFFAYRLLLKDRLVYSSGLAFGIGHGGIEAILLVGLTYVNNLVFSLMLNAGKLEIFLDGKIDSAMITYIGNALATTPPDSFLAGGVERVLTMVFQVALSVMILEGIVRGRTRFFYLLALLAHGGVNLLVVLVVRVTNSMWLSEWLLAVVAVISLVYIAGSKRRFGDKLEAKDEALQAVEEGY